MKFSMSSFSVTRSSCQKSTSAFNNERHARILSVFQTSKRLTRNLPPQSTHLPILTESPFNRITLQPLSQHKHVPFRQKIFLSS